MKITLINNKFVIKKDAQIPITSDLMCGYGVFETLKTNSKEPENLKEHVNRLFSSAKKIGLKPRHTKLQIIDMVQRTTKKSPHKTQRIKIIALSTHTIVISTPHRFDKKLYKTGVALKTIVRNRAVPEVKSISYLPSFLSHKQAVKAGAFEALLVDEKGEVYEGAYSNIFWFEGDTLCTRDTEVLPGITRDAILQKSSFPTKFKKTTLAQLLQKSEIFITSSIVKILPVTKIDKTKIGTGKPGKKTLKIIQTTNCQI